MHWLGVTRVLRLGGLITESPFDNEAARDRGRVLHAITAAWDEGLHGVLRKVPPDLMPAIECYQTFLAETRPVWHAIEEPVQREDARVRGMLDRRGIVVGSQAVVDLKFGGVKPWHGVQLFGYHWIRGCPSGERRFGLYLGGRRPKLIEFDDPDDERRWAQALRDARFSDREDTSAPSPDDGLTEESLIWPA